MCGGGCEEIRTSIWLVKIDNIDISLENSLAVLQMVIKLPQDPTIHYLGISPEEVKTYGLTQCVHKCL